MIKLILFFLLWGGVAWKRADSGRNAQTFSFIFLFLFFTLFVRLLFLLFYPAVFSGLNATALLQGFSLGLRFDFSMLALWGGACLFLINLPIVHLTYRRSVIGLSVAVLMCYVWLLVADLVYFQYVQRHIGPDIFNFFLSVSTVIKVALISYWWICIGIGILFAAGLYFSQRYISSERPLKRGKWQYEILFFACLGFFVWFADRGYFFTNSQFSPRQAYLNHIVQGHFALNGVFNIIYQLMPRYYIPNAKNWNTHPSLSELSEEESLDISKKLLGSSRGEWTGTRYPLQREQKQFSNPSHKKNLIIFALESLDFNSVDAVSGSHVGATPNLDALMRQGQIFDRFFACTDGSSLVGIGAIMSGICWVSGMPYFGHGLEQINQNGLGSLFAQNGYKAVFVRACGDKEMYIGPLARLMGFETYDKEQIKKRSGKNAVYDGEALEVLAEQFKNSSQPFVGFFFSTATHEPFELWSPQKEAAHIAPQFEKQPYLRALAYTDKQIGKFIRFLQDNDLYKDTAFIIVGDHHRREVSASAQERYHVPFAVVAPGVLKPKHSDTIAGQTDILPTLVDLFHLQTPYTAMGKSLLDDTAKDWTFVTQAGEDFAFITPKGFIPSRQPHEKHRDMVALNKAVRTALKNNVWAP